MSNADVIQDTSLTLKSLIEQRLNGTGAPRLGAPVTVTVDSPHRGNQGEFRLNLFLYNIIQDEGRRNSGGWVPISRTAKSQKFAVEPLALRLYYLLTAFANDGLTEHHLLGEAMQALFVNRRLAEELLKGSLKTGPLRAEHVEINLLNLDVDALQKIWGSQTEFLRTSVAYEVVPIFLDADQPDAEVPLVEDRNIGTLPSMPYPSVIAPEAAPAGAVVSIYGSGLLVPQPVTGNNLVRVLFDGIEAEQLPGGRSERALGVRVPEELKPGSVAVQLQLDRYQSRSIPFTVLPPP